MSLILKESGVWHLPTADRGPRTADRELETNPESQLLKANRSKMGPEEEIRTSELCGAEN